MKTKIITD